MILNPEPNLRPLSIARPHEQDVSPATVPAPRNPVSDPGPPPASVPSTPDPNTSHVTSRLLDTVPVRSKQRSCNTEDRQPKKKQRSGGLISHSSSSRPVPLPPSRTFLMKDSIQTTQMKKRSQESSQSILRQLHADPPPSAISSTTPVDHPTPPTTVNPILTVSPKALPPNPSIRHPPSESDRGTAHSSIRP